ncbi:hypothetical protein FTUN_0062 [Frigoriglobus tundricola]|uniref:Uncharacterized protein n=1 Tax=Frigoriglobus tundricola TaxID=2774151 RepID=A0A6M5YH20_9BACT|nr:hypothetical protein FTUN_0062 [Frigoriglobus tundricola]
MTARIVCVTVQLLSRTSAPHLASGAPDRTAGAARVRRIALRYGDARGGSG